MALIADLQGPKLRIGDLSEPVELVRGGSVTISGEDGARDGDLPILPAVLGSVLQPGFDVLIDDGAVRLRVLDVERGRARCEVLVGGTVISHKGVNLPGIPLPIPSLTRKDIDDLQFALELGCDFVALSFVRTASDVQALKTLIEASGSTAHVIAKIEKAEAVAVLDDILREADAVMVARGDLGVEMGAVAVPLLQKRIILRSLERGKPVITATQMLESMIHAPEPTRAEASDVANAILDGTSAIMLSGETAVGEFPARVGGVHGPDRAGRRAESRLPPRDPAGRREADRRPGDVERRLRHRGGARGEGDPRPDLHRPHRVGRRAPAASPSDPRPDPSRYSLQHMALEWGVTPVSVPECADVEELWATSLSAARDDGDRRVRRPRRDHRRHRGEHPRLDQRDQGRHRLAEEAAGRWGIVPRGPPNLSLLEARAARQARDEAPPARAPVGRAPALVRARRRRLHRLPLLPAGIQLLRDPLLARTAGGGGAQLREERSRLEARLADSTTVTALSREARRMSLVRPGERLFIVKGVQQWRRAQARQSGATIGRDG